MAAEDQPNLRKLHSTVFTLRYADLWRIYGDGVRCRKTNSNLAKEAMRDDVKTGNTGLSLKIKMKRNKNEVTLAAQKLHSAEKRKLRNMDASENRNENTSGNEPQTNEKGAERVKDPNAEDNTEKDSKAEEVGSAEQRVGDRPTNVEEGKPQEVTNMEDKEEEVGTAEENGTGNEPTDNGDGKIPKDNDNAGGDMHDAIGESSLIAEAQKEEEGNIEQSKTSPENTEQEGIANDQLNLKKDGDLSTKENYSIVKSGGEGLNNDKIVKPDNEMENDKEGDKTNEKSNIETKQEEMVQDAGKDKEITEMTNNSDNEKEEILEETTSLEVIEEGVEKAEGEKHDEDLTDVTEGKRATKAHNNEGYSPILTDNPVTENDKMKEDSNTSEAVDRIGHKDKEGAKQKNLADGEISQGAETQIDTHLKNLKGQDRKTMPQAEGQTSEEQGQKLDTDQQITGGEQQEPNRAAVNKVEGSAERAPSVHRRSRSVERERRSSTSSSGRSHRRSSRSSRRGSSLERSGRQREEENVHFQDYLTRQVKEGRESESYLRQKLEQKDHELETAERKVNDLQLRLKRFVKDDKAKDERILLMERELRDLNDKFSTLSDMVDQNANSASSTNQVTNGAVRNTQKNSKSCVIL